MKSNEKSKSIEIPINRSIIAEANLTYIIYLYTNAVKNAVRNMISVNIEKSPKVNETISIFGLDFRLNPINIGKIGRMQGDNIEITPVKKEIRGNTSI